MMSMVSAPVPDDGQPAAPPPLILVVDDVPDNLIVMSELLSDYRLKVATSGAKALRLASATPRPDLILLDLMMPEMDGYEVCRRLKADPATAGIPVIFLTARNAAEDEQVGLETGAVDYISKPINAPVVLARVRTHLELKRMSDLLQDKNAFLEAEIQRRARELLLAQERAAAQIARLSTHDALTGLPNRTAFAAEFDKVLQRATAQTEQFALIYLGLKHLKEVNDTFGHLMGDQLLHAVAQRLAAVAGGAFLSRHGGDEFVMIVEDNVLLDDLVADKLQSAVAGEVEIDGHRLRLGLSAGIVRYPVDGTDTVTLMGNAGAALHRAREDVVGAIRFYEQKADSALRHRRALAQELRPALERSELVVYYQPQTKMDGTYTGFEALVRWKHPTRGFVSPASFIPAAEESGLILPIGEQILRQSCLEAAAWPKPLNIAVNLSPLQFRDIDLPEMVDRVLRETRLAPERLELEITESVLIEDFKRVVAILRRLQGLGVRIAMDDFGTGYSSLATLQAFPFDKMKVDRSFIIDLEKPQSKTIVRAVIGLGRGLGLPVLAEGVETQEQLGFLTEEGCSGVQGYLFGKPQPIESYAHLVGRAPAPEAP